jgi:pilus assembly protein CpaE
LAVIMLCSSLETSTLVAAMQAGIREVLSTPLVPAELLASLQRMAQRQHATPSVFEKKAKIVSFLSCKGGSGATFLATNFADVLAKDFDQKTIFLDLDLHYGDAAYYVSQGPNQSDITELTRQINRLDAQLLASSVLHIGPKLDLLSAPEDPEASYSISDTELVRLMQVVQANYDMVVLDVERVLGPLTIKALDMSDVIYLVMENLLPFVRDAKRLVTKFKALGYSDSKIRVVVNRYEKNSTIDIAQIEKALGLKVSYTIRSNFADAAQAINTGVPITDINPNSPIVQVLRTMAHTFDDNALVKKPNWFEHIFKHVN